MSLSTIQKVSISVYTKYFASFWKLDAQEQQHQFIACVRVVPIVLVFMQVRVTQNVQPTLGLSEFVSGFGFSKVFSPTTMPAPQCSPDTVVVWKYHQITVLL